jgi:hypothetical protein
LCIFLRGDQAWFPFSGLEALFGYIVIQAGITSIFIGGIVKISMPRPASGGSIGTVFSQLDAGPGAGILSSARQLGVKSVKLRRAMDRSQSTMQLLHPRDFGWIAVASSSSSLNLGIRMVCGTDS